MIAEIKVIKKPKYKLHYKKGDIGFVHRMGDDADWICKLIALLDSKVFALVRSNHTFLMTGENSLLENAGLHGNGVKELTLDEFLAKQPSDFVFLRRPKDLNEKTADQIIKQGRKLIGKKFDMWPIWWIGLEKFFRLETLLKHRPVPKIGTNLMCSNFIALLFYERYKFFSPFSDRNWTKITPWHLWTGNWLEPGPY